MGSGTLPVQRDAASAALVRQQLAADLTTLGVDRTCVDDAILIASELVSNAVRHGASPDASHIAVSWDLLPSERPEDVLIRVQDGSTASPLLREARLDASDGRGLAIVAALASAWGVEEVSHGKRVWARVPIHF